MDRTKRLRRVVLLMASFARNLAYNRALDTLRPRIPLNSERDFWMTVGGNCLDMAVLDWCKLIADKGDKHHWSQIVTDAKSFEVGLLGELNVLAGEFAEYAKSMRHYRDKFVAHLDSDEELNIPHLEMADRCIRYYHAHLIAHELEDLWQLHNLPASIEALSTYYENESQVASTAYDRALPQPAPRWG